MLSSNNYNNNDFSFSEDFPSELKELSIEIKDEVSKNSSNEEVKNIKEIIAIINQEMDAAINSVKNWKPIVNINASNNTAKKFELEKTLSKQNVSGIFSHILLETALNHYWFRNASENTDVVIIYEHSLFQSMEILQKNTQPNKEYPTDDTFLGINNKNAYHVKRPEDLLKKVLNSKTKCFPTNTTATSTQELKQEHKKFILIVPICYGEESYKTWINYSKPKKFVNGKELSVDDFIEHKKIEQIKHKSAEDVERDAESQRATELIISITDYLKNILSQFDKHFPFDVSIEVQIVFGRRFDTHDTRNVIHYINESISQEKIRREFDTALNKLIKRWPHIRQNTDTARIKFIDFNQITFERDYISSLKYILSWYYHTRLYSYITYDVKEKLSLQVKKVIKQNAVREEKDAVVDKQQNNSLQIIVSPIEPKNDSITTKQLFAYQIKDSAAPSHLSLLENLVSFSPVSAENKDCQNNNDKKSTVHKLALNNSNDANSGQLNVPSELGYYPLLLDLAILYNIKLNKDQEDVVKSDIAHTLTAIRNFALEVIEFLPTEVKRTPRSLIEDLVLIHERLESSNQVGFQELIRNFAIVIANHMKDQSLDQLDVSSYYPLLLDLAILHKMAVEAKDNERQNVIKKFALSIIPTVAEKKRTLIADLLVIINKMNNEKRKTLELVVLHFALAISHINSKARPSKIDIMKRPDSPSSITASGNSSSGSNNSSPANSPKSQPNSGIATAPSSCLSRSKSSSSSSLNGNTKVPQKTTLFTWNGRSPLSSSKTTSVVNGTASSSAPSSSISEILARHPVGLRAPVSDIRRIPTPPSSSSQEPLTSSIFMPSLPDKNKPQSGRNGKATPLSSITKKNKA